MMEILDRANRLKCEMNLIGGAHSEMGPLAWVMGSTQNEWRKTIVEGMRIVLPKVQKKSMVRIGEWQITIRDQGLGSQSYKDRRTQQVINIWIT